MPATIALTWMARRCRALSHRPPGRRRRDDAGGGRQARAPHRPRHARATGRRRRQALPRRGRAERRADRGL
eukprot:4402111-Prymnesium_polylepis.2